MKYLTKENIQRRVAEFSKCLVVEFAGAAKLPQGELLDDACRLLVEAGAKSYRPFGLCADDAGLNAETAGRAKAQVVNDGLFREWKGGWPHKGSGGHPIFLELLAAGEKALLDMKINPFRPKGRGDFRHSVFQNGYLASYFEKQKIRYELEYNAGSKQIDVVWWDSYKRINAIEIVVSGSAEHNANEAVRCGIIEGICKVVVCCYSKDLMKMIKKLLMREMMNLQEKISVEWIGDYWPWKDDDAKKDVSV